MSAIDTLRLRLEHAVEHGWDAVALTVEEGAEILFAEANADLRLSEAEHQRDQALAPREVAGAPLRKEQP